MATIVAASGARLSPAVSRCRRDVTPAADPVRASDVGIPSWEPHLERWEKAGLVDGAHAARIRAYERAHGADAPGTSRWVRFVVALGACLLGAGVLLFVSAHWDELSPAARMSLVVGMVVLVHTVAAAAAKRAPGIATALHAVGTVSLGAAIALAGQIYNLAEHWPAATLLWASGAALGWTMLRQWPQALFVALLVPAWLGGEWAVAMQARDFHGGTRPLLLGACLLAVTYLTGRQDAEDGPVRRALGWTGGLALLPTAALLATSRGGSVAGPAPGYTVASGSLYTVGWVAALVLPLAVAVALRGAGAWWNAGAALWGSALAAAAAAAGPHAGGGQLPIYALCAAGAAGLVIWGVREDRSERINLGIAGEALTILVFYFSDVMDKLGRSASLVGLGILFIAGGWAMERARRSLLAGLESRAVEGPP